MILLTGAAGYIGSHILVELLQRGQQVVALDNLSTGDLATLREAEGLGRSAAGESGKGELFFQQGDVRDGAFLAKLFQRFPIEAVIHLAGLKVIQDSLARPLDYYDNNVNGSLQLISAMAQAGVYRCVFSSTAAVYGVPDDPVIREHETQVRPISPYGRSKAMTEQMLSDLAASDPRWRIGILRYFNPVGGHPSGKLGEKSPEQPTNLVPAICRVAQGRRSFLPVFGDDYPTRDGTAVRDYLHISDLVQGHLAAMQFLLEHEGVHIWNLGTGRGYSVLEMINTFETVTGYRIPHRFMPRREGDIAACWTAPDKAASELGWRALHPLEQMLMDAWSWEQTYSGEGKQPWVYGEGDAPALFGAALR